MSIRWLTHMRDRLGCIAMEEEVAHHTWVVIADVFSMDTATPSVVPAVYERGRCSTVLFVWHKGGWDVEIEVGPYVAHVWARRQSDGHSLYGPLPEMKDELLRILAEISAIPKAA